MNSQMADRKISTSGAFKELVKFEIKLAARDPIGLLFGLVAPILMLAIFGSIPYFRALIPGTTLTIFESYIPILIAMAVIFIALLSLPLPLARDREIGWLRRISTTPVPPTRLLAAQVIINLLAVSASIVIVLAISWAIFGASMPLEPFGFALSIILVIAALFGIGLFVTSLASTQNMAVGFMQLLLYPLLFFAGVYFPMSLLPGFMSTIAQYTPVGAAVSAMTSTLTGAFPPAQDLLVMAAYAVVFCVAAARYFKWE